MKQTKKLVLGGITTALTVFLMILAGLIPIGTYAVPVIASMIYIVLAKENGYGWAVMSYAATAILSVFLCFDKETALNFILFFGYYPILRCLLEKIKPKILRLIIKFIIFNAAMLGIFFIAKYILMIPDDSYVIFGLYIPGLILAFGNLVFLIYDYVLAGLIVQYDERWKKIIHSIIKM